MAPTDEEIRWLRLLEQLQFMEAVKSLTAEVLEEVERRITEDSIR